eukprot:4736242-Pyramimonas_sp.AAC.1
MPLLVYRLVAATETRCLVLEYAAAVRAAALVHAVPTASVARPDTFNTSACACATPCSVSVLSVRRGGGTRLTVRRGTRCCEMHGTMQRTRRGMRLRSTVSPVTLLVQLTKRYTAQFIISRYGREEGTSISTLTFSR